jgi:hypothetical protein
MEYIPHHPPRDQNTMSIQNIYREIVQTDPKTLTRELNEFRKKFKQ